MVCGCGCAALSDLLQSWPTCSLCKCLSSVLVVMALAVNYFFDFDGCFAEDVPGPDGRLISTEERMQHIQQSREDVQQDTEGRQGRWLACCVATHLWHREGVLLQSGCFVSLCVT